MKNNLCLIFFPAKKSVSYLKIIKIISTPSPFIYEHAKYCSFQKFNYHLLQTRCLVRHRVHSQCISVTSSDVINSCSYVDV